MQKVSVQLSPEQAERLLEQLSVSVKINLLRRWEKETWPVRLRQLLGRIDEKIRQNPRVAQAALKVAQPARRAFYAGRRRH